MNVISHRAWLTALALCVLIPTGSHGATPPGQVIQIDQYAALRVPADSPVRFERRGEDPAVYFSGGFVLAGRYFLQCEVDCDGPITDSNLTLVIYPDRALAARLPRWSQFKTGIAITITNPEPVMRMLLSPEKKTALLTGRVDHVTGHTAIYVDRLLVSIECDSPSYTAHFVRMAEPPAQKLAQRESEYGCL